MSGRRSMMLCTPILYHTEEYHPEQLVSSYGFGRWVLPPARRTLAVASLVKPTASAARAACDPGTESNCQWRGRRRTAWLRDSWSLRAMLISEDGLGNAASAAAAELAEVSGERVQRAGRVA